MWGVSALTRDEPAPFVVEGKVLTTDHQGNPLLGLLKVILKNNFISLILILAALGCCMQAFSSCS